MSLPQTLPAIKHLLLSINFSILLILLFSFSVLITDVNLESPDLTTFWMEYLLSINFELLS